MNDAKNSVHPFEVAKLGKAPFRVTGYTVAKFQACPGAPIQCGSSCDYCGTGIMNVYFVTSSDGQTFKVGCDCVQRATGNAHRSEMRTARYEFINAGYLATKRANAEARRLASEKLADECTVTYAAGLEALFQIVATTKSGYVRSQAMYWGRMLLEGKVPSLEYFSRTKGRVVDDSPLFWIALGRASLPQSAPVGEVGKRLRNITATVSHVAFYDGAYGRVYVNNLVTDHGEILIWRTTSGRVGEAGDRITLTGTVKKYGEYNGEKQTELTRCKVA